MAAAVALLLYVVSGVALANSCVECHKDPIFRLHNHKLYTYYQDWLTSPHQEAGLTCNQCHGGNPDSDDPAIAHEGVLHPSNPRSRVFYQNQPETCGECHSEVTDQFTKSKHYTAVNQFLAAPNCSTCHRAMNKKPYYHSIVSDTCKRCHWQPEQAAVAGSAEEILRRLNIAKGYLGWSSLYFSSQGWPDGSEPMIEGFKTRYHDIMAKGHSFDLLRSDRDSAELLTELKAMFEGAWDTCKAERACKGLGSSP